jgi:hypothetical protein
LEFFNSMGRWLAVGLAPQSSPSPICPIFSIVWFRQTLGTAASRPRPAGHRLRRKRSCQPDRILRPVSIGAENRDRSFIHENVPFVQDRAQNLQLGFPKVAVARKARLLRDRSRTRSRLRRNEPEKPTGTQARLIVRKVSSPDRFLALRAMARIHASVLSR